MANFWKFFDRLRLRNKTSDPTDLTNGEIWYNSTSGQFKFYQNGSTSTLTSLDSHNDLINLTFTTSVASNALTIALKTKAGNDPSISDPVKIGFRNSSNDVATYDYITITSAISLTISSGSTLGHTSGIEWPIYIYAINNSGTVVLGASTAPINDRFVVSTTAEGGAGAADSAIVMYSTSAQTNKACRCIGKVYSTQTTAGTWATNTVKRIIGIDPNTETISVRYTTNSGSSITSSTVTYVDFEDKVFETHPMVTGAGGGNTTTAGTGFKITFPVAGLYEIKINEAFASTSFAAGDRMEISINKNTSPQEYVTQHGNGATMFNQCSAITIIDAIAGDYTQGTIFQNTGVSKSMLNDGRYNSIEIKRIGIK